MSGIAIALIPTFVFIGEQALQVLQVPQHVMNVLFIPAPLWRQQQTEVHVTPCTPSCLTRYEEGEGGREGGRERDSQRTLCSRYPQKTVVISRAFFFFRKKKKALLITTEDYPGTRGYTASRPVSHLQFRKFIVPAATIGGIDAKTPNPKP